MTSTTEEKVYLIECIYSIVKSLIFIVHWIVDCYGRFAAACRQTTQVSKFRTCQTSEVRIPDGHKITKAYSSEVSIHRTAIYPTFRKPEVLFPRIVITPTYRSPESPKSRRKEVLCRSSPYNILIHTATASTIVILHLANKLAKMRFFYRIIIDK